MKRIRLASLLLVLVSLLCACAEALPTEPSVSASIGELTLVEIPNTETDEPLEEQTEPEAETSEAFPTRDISQMTANEILALSQQLCCGYYAFTRNAVTRTRVTIDGELIESELKSELAVKAGNAVFRRSSAEGDEEYHLVDSFLCFVGALGKYRIGGMSVTSFLEMFSDQLPAGSFDEGRAESTDGGIILSFEGLSAAGVAYLRDTLELSDRTQIRVERSSLTVCTDTDGNMLSAVTALELGVWLDEREVMRLLLDSEMKQNSIVGIIDLDSPNIADHALFPSLEAIAFYESAVPEVALFKTKRDAFQFVDERSTKITSNSLSLSLSEHTDYAYASRIGLSIEKQFDTGDGVAHSVLTHFNKRRGFSQIDGGNIFVDSTVNKNNLFVLTFRPFESAFFSIDSCKSAQIEAENRIALNLNDSVVRDLARQILLSSGIACDDLHISKLTRAVTYIELDPDGKLASVGYELSLNLSLNGKSYTLEHSVDITVTSHNSAKVKVIYIDVPEEEE